MGFHLTIAQGKEAGKEFAFEQESVTIGRTSDCDVILYDPGVSRKHARIFAEGGKYFVEDMGSSNGTRLNGTPIAQRQQLGEGDAVTLGPVVFNFHTRSLEPNTDAGLGDGQGDGSTRIVSLDSIRSPATALAPPGASADELSRMSRTTTRSSKQVAPSEVTNVKPRPSNPNLPAARPAAGRPAAAPARTQSNGALSAAAAGPGKLTAAERARIKRENSAKVAEFKLFWAEASGKVRMAILAALGVVVLAAAGGGLYAATRESDVGKLPPEPGVLGPAPLTFSFGLPGPGGKVDYLRADMKVFQFEFTSPTRAVVILHYQAKDVAAQEVSITVNGQALGNVPPDAINADEVMHQLLIPPTALKKGEPNEVIFDNTRNPPGNDPWRIWNIRVETTPLPEVPPAQLLRDATEYFRRAQQNEERATIGAPNLYNAWKDFRTAWLMLEVHPDPKPELYLLARDSVKRTQQALDRRCRNLLLEAAQAYQHKDWAGAKSTLTHIKDYFPNARDQTCQARAEAKMWEWDL